jgi:hypothetical protein
MTAGHPTMAWRSQERSRAERPVAAFVWLVWAATIASILLFIAHDGRNIPFEEDWLMVAPMTGHEPDLLPWLWSQNSEHRLPLPRLVNLALLRATGDFRSTMVFNALALGAVAAAMILVARALRDRRTRLADAFFPLLLLQLGNWDNLVWGWQIQFVLPTVLVCALLLIIVARPTLPTGVVAVAGALALIGLPLSGANGMVFAPMLAAWFAYVAWAARRVPQRDRSVGSRLPAAAAVLAALLCAIYFIGYESSPWNAPSPGLRATLETSGKFLALAVGPAAAKSWLLFGGVVLVVLLASLGVLRGAWRRRSDERVRIIGLIAFFTAVTALALAVGWGRAGRAAETGRMSTRYVLLAAPALCAVYFTLLLFGKDWMRRAGPAALALLMALLFPFNTLVGLERRDWFGAGMAAFERDLASGASAALLARRHHSFMLHWDEPLMIVGLKQLHDAGIGPFARWEPNPLGRPDTAVPKR